MRRLLIVLVPLALMAAGGAAWWMIRRDGFTPPPPWTDDMQVIADGNNRFAFDLYAQLRQKEGNLFFSPYSAHTALAMTATGARGKTRDEMVKVLHLPDDDQRMLASGDLAGFYAHPRKDFELSVANALWGQKGCRWRPEWLDMQNARFDAGFHEADFQANPEAERQRINRWVEEKTRRPDQGACSPRLDHSDDQDGSGQRGLLQGEVGDAVRSKAHSRRVFHLADDGRVKVPMMYGAMKCGYAQRVRAATGRSEFQVAELPYKGGELSMVVILPDTPRRPARPRGND